VNKEFSFGLLRRPQSRVLPGSSEAGVNHGAQTY